MVVHTLVTGGRPCWTPARRLSVLEQFQPEVELVVWVNEYFGPVVTLGGQDLEQTQVVQP